MTKFIGGSPGITSVKMDQSWKADFYIDVYAGWALRKTYYPGDIAHIEEIDAETYRSGGGAAVGAIVGGVLTGGIGLLAGAAIGGRRRTTGSYLIVFKDGNHIAFEEKRNSMIKKIKLLLAKSKANSSLQDLISAKSPPQIEGYIAFA